MSNKSTTYWTRAFLAGLLLVTGLQSARAETYTYTGNDFQSASSPYTMNDFVSGFFTVTTALADNLSLQSITPATYSFTDGVQTFTSAAPPPNVTFKVATDGSGNIDAWDIALQSGVNIVSTATSEDFGTSGGGLGDNFFDAGTWQASTGGGGGSTVPEPGYAAFIAIGLGTIAVVRRRFA
ncbi:MAG TPA: hypothetical protein VKT81_01455 [Bryobacteraceae bacterium]|nr:hypothetical protein [Bryobacteraceae bacterium]